MTYEVTNMKGIADCEHDFVVEQEGDVLSRVVCSDCGEVRIEQVIDRNFVLVWSSGDYQIADRFYRELVS